MLSLFKKLDGGAGQTGFFRTPAGLATAQLMRAPSGAKPVLTHCSFDAGVDEDALTRATRQLPNRKLPAVTVLPASAYSMLLVEAPDVPADELRAAVRWRIKDLIDFHIDDAVLDVFQMPSRGHGGPNQMMYAIAAKADGVRNEVDAAEHAGIKLKAIDILELSLRNIAAMLEDDGRGVGLLYLGQTTGVLLLVRQGILYLARRFETGVQTLNDAETLRSELVAGLALEARRSLDYFESHYEQSSIPVIYTAGLAPADIDQMASELTISVRHVELASLFDVQTEYDDETSRRCMPAIGGALRRDEVAL
ncbi:MAG: pilus assembly protein PilM [Gammaproteobacteria bacterium]|nr:pilus assembly protein PilM [Gammaproteobacteria bacterium]